MTEAVTRTVGFLHRPTDDGRLLTGVTVDKLRYPVFMTIDDELHAIGRAKVSVVADVVSAEIDFAPGQTEPDGCWPVIELRPGETSTTPYADGVDRFVVFDASPTMMVGVLSAIVYVDNPAWPELRQQ